METNLNNKKSIIEKILNSYKKYNIKNKEEKSLKSNKDIFDNLLCKK